MSKKKKKTANVGLDCSSMNGFTSMYGMTGDVGAGGGAGGYGGNYGGWGIRWIYALLLLIVIVLQFGRRQNVISRSIYGEEVDSLALSTGYGYGVQGDNGLFNNQLIDNSVLFIIVVFLLIICAGCWSGGWGNYGAAGGYGGGCGMW